MVAHDSILVDLANEARLLAIMGAEERMIPDAASKVERSSNGRSRQDAIKVNPLSTILRPSGPTKSLVEASVGDGPLQCDQMLTGHLASPQRRCSTFGPGRPLLSAPSGRGILESSQAASAGLTTRTTSRSSSTSRTWSTAPAARASLAMVFRV